MIKNEELIGATIVNVLRGFTNNDVEIQTIRILLKNGEYANINAIPYESRDLDGYIPDAYLEVERGI